jgi:hypothetical protein
LWWWIGKTRQPRSRSTPRARLLAIEQKWNDSNSIRHFRIRTYENWSGQDARNECGGEQRTDTWNTIKALARLIGAVPGQDHSIKFQDLLFEAEQLTTRKLRCPDLAGCHVSSGNRS